ncbi:MAG: helix-turn-helix domain-containing protein [Promethearchaeota archaeon]|nr:MAG: helix-turn-helix domain-containing protein [Candidatus Lokiarchaeota archaeon]
MSQNSYEGTISKKYRNKEIIKTSIGSLIYIIPMLITFLLLLFLLKHENFEEALILTIILLVTTTLLPILIILIISYLYETAYINNFSYSFSKENIVINHGVFTKTRATIPYSRIQNINIVNGVFDRMYDLYTVKIETAGSAAAAQAAQGGGFVRPEGYIPGLKEPDIIEKKINEMVTQYAGVPSGLEDKIFKPEELAFDNFISYIMSKMRTGEKLETKITQLRQKANLSQEKLAEEVGVPIQTIEYLEEGRYNPSLFLAYKIADALNCEIEELFKMR